MDNFLRWLAAARPILEALAIVATPIAAFLALYNYHRSVKLERAKWIKELYEKFYEQPILKHVRDILDGNDVQAISQMVENEESRFTDYLNFFEFVAFLFESKQIRENEVAGMFDYYLNDLRKHPAVLSYINDRNKGFEKLRKLVDANLRG